MSAALKPVFSSAAVVSRASRIARLAQIISGETTKVDDYVQSNGLPPLSFHPRAPRSCPVPSSAIDIQMSRKAVINATKELQMLMMGPRESMRWDAWRHYDLLSLHFVNKYRIAHIVPLDGDMSFSAISKEIGINEDYVKRFLRHAMTNRIFRESPSGYVAHTTASVTLREDSEISDWIWMQTEESVGLTHRTLDLLERFPASEEPKDAVYPKSKGEDVPMYEIIARDPEKAKRFGRTMHGFTKTQGWEIATLVEHYDWASLGDGTIIDVSLSASISLP